MQGWRLRLGVGIAGRTCRERFATLLLPNWVAKGGTERDGALTRLIDRLLIDEQGIDHPAHLDELLPIPAVATEARDLPGRHRSDLAEADLRYHAFESGAGDRSGRRAAKIAIDDLDLAPAELAEPIPHGILQEPALLMCITW